MPLAQLEPLIAGLGMARSRFVYGLERVPEERLNWSPGGTAKSALQLADKMAGFLGFFTHLIEHQTMPDRGGAMPPVSESLDAAKAAVESAFDRITAAVTALTEADLSKPVPTPWGVKYPLYGMLWWVLSITGYFQGQLNYFQTAYGDEDPNIPPSWMQGSPS